MFAVLYGHPACTWCVSIEVAPFLPLFFAASVSSTERFRHRHVRLSHQLAGSSLRSTMPKRDLSLDFLCIVRLLEGIIMVLHLSGSPFLTSINGGLG